MIQKLGHVQYFSDLKGRYLSETIDALGIIKAIEQKEILISVVNLFRILKLHDINCQEKFIDKVLVGYDYEFENQQKENLFVEHINRFDRDYYNCPITINDLLEKYLEKHEQEFIEIVEN